MAMHGEDDGEAQENGERGRWPAGHGLGAHPDEDAVLFDIEELNIEWSEWLPGVDYTRAMLAAIRGESTVWQLLRRVRHRGSRVRTREPWWRTRRSSRHTACSPRLAVRMARV